jgi:acyl-CoA thioesterase
MTEPLIDRVIRADAQLIEHMGIRVAETGHGTCALVATPRSELINSVGMVHGGFVFTLADTAAAYALACRDIHGITISSHLAFTRSGRIGEEVRADAKVETAGRRIATVSVKVTSWERLLAHGTIQFSVVEPRV